MTQLTQQEIDAHLAEPNVAHLVTVRPDGRPHVAPVWFEWREGHALVMTGADAVKVRNLRRNPSVALSIAASQRPYWYVVLEGEATVTTDGLAPMVERICVRYDGPERGAAFAAELLDEGDMVLIDLEVRRLISWRDDE